MRYVRSSAANLRRVGSGVAVYVPGRQAIHVLNSTAQLLFEYLAEPATLDELVEALVMATRGQERVIREDLAGALEELVEHGIIEPCAG